ncbi:hypothetical protein ACQPWW_01335 [Micromonospora sp. CA-240977]|uniref:hypothetical protein n=1 Tax=Micromonospora sp. CA-240977 TaxID=3239957 RepID=UPI003D8EF658
MTFASYESPHHCTPKACMTNTAMLVIQVCVHDGDDGRVARIDQWVRVLVAEVRGVATVATGSLAPPNAVAVPWRPSGSRERLRVPLSGGRERVAAIGDRAG